MKVAGSRDNGKNNIYRIEHATRGTGMWYDEYSNHIDYMNTNAPMPRDDKVFSRYGKVWYNATTDKENFKDWFSEEFTRELLANGYVILKLKVTEWQYYDNHILYTKESVYSREVLDIEDIYPQ